jgi:hypothetical protein
MLLKIWLL